MAYISRSNLAGMREVFTAQNTRLNKIMRGANNGLTAAAQVILQRSQIYVPVDTTALKRSGRVEVIGDGAVAVVYGDATVFYAIYVHEMTHLNHAPPTGAKFVDRAVQEMMPRVTRIIADAAGGRLPKDFGLGNQTFVLGPGGQAEAR